MSCENHKKEIAGISDAKVLARMTADSHYEFLFEYLLELYRAIEQDGIKNYEAGKERHAADLQYLGMGLWEAALRAEKVWKRVRPFMQPKK